jgi:hypothetical protein
MYTDKYLKFTDEVAAIDILYSEIPVEWNEDGAPTFWTIQPNYANIDVLGTLYEKQDIPDPENPPPPIPIPGWHVNVRVVEGEDGEPLVPFEVHPEFPRRVWG